MLILLCVAQFRVQVLSLLRWEVSGLNVTGAEVALSSLASTASSDQGPLAHSRLIRAFHSAMGGEGSFYHSTLHPRIDSQDGWIFRAPLPQAVVDDASFEIGRPRCVYISSKESRLCASCR